MNSESINNRKEIDWMHGRCSVLKEQTGLFCYTVAKVSGKEVQIGAIIPHKDDTFTIQDEHGTDVFIRATIQTIKAYSEVVK